MNKVLMLAPIIGIAILAVAFKSQELRDGYRLQGFQGHHGWVFKGYFSPTITAGVMGVQGCDSGYIFGWVRSEEYFILNTQSGITRWLEFDALVDRLERLGCPAPDMNKEINLVGFAKGKTFISD